MCFLLIVCRSSTYFYRNPANECSYITCQNSGIVNIQGRTRFTAAIEACGAGTGVPRSFRGDKLQPCEEGIDACVIGKLNLTKKS